MSAETLGSTTASTAAANGAHAAPLGENAAPERLVAWTLDRFAGQRMVITTSFGMEGCALIDMYASHGKPLTVVYLDTMFFFPETYALRDRMAERYPHIDFLNRGTTLTVEQQNAIHGPNLWRRDPDTCCRLRKVEPMRAVLAEADVWVTGLMKSQSATRATVRVVDWDWSYHVLKVSPLANWDRTKVWDYVQRHDVPHNELHERGYPSIGCTHCTAPVPGASVTQYTRLGRWVGNGKTECGLHIGGSGI